MSTASRFHELVSGRWKGPLPAFLRAVLRALEFPYGYAIQIRNARFDRGVGRQHSVEAPVLSIGNLTVGGTGKTPFVAWLADWLTAQGIAATIISRGYGSRDNQPNDEALELAARLPHVPHIQKADRVAAATSALQTNPHQALILDDGFQHRRLARDLDIVLIDALEPFGYGHLLPRGLLREPVASLARAHVVALSRSDAVPAARRSEIESRVRAVAPQAIWLELVHEPAGLVSAGGQARTANELHGRRVAAFCGIGNPAGFRHTLQSLGIDVIDLRSLPDHCAYDQRDLAGIARWLATLGPLDGVLCTHKDLVKIKQEEIAGLPLLALRVAAKVVRGQEDLERILAATLRRLAPNTP